MRPKGGSHMGVNFFVCSSISFSIASCKANASCVISFLHDKQRPHSSGPFNQNKWELPASDQPTCGEDEALIELLLDKAETAYWANAPTCCDRSRNVTSRCLAGRRGGRQEAWGVVGEKKKAVEGGRKLESKMERRDARCTEMKSNIEAKGKQSAVSSGVFLNFTPTNLNVAILSFRIILSFLGN